MTAAKTIKITISNSKIFYKNNKNYYLKSKIFYENLKKYYLNSKNPTFWLCPSVTIKIMNFFRIKVMFTNNFSPCGGTNN